MYIICLLHTLVYKQPQGGSSIQLGISQPLDYSSIRVIVTAERMEKGREEDLGN